MKPDFSNTVIVIGGDHHNTLAVTRCLGKWKCRQKALIHTNYQRPEQLHISRSKYLAGNTFCVEEKENAIFRWLLANTAEEKQILFPTSDFAAYVIDMHYHELSEYFIMPGLKDAPGRVAELMDKWKQSEFAKLHELPMAKTWEIVKTGDSFMIPADMVYPCIVKPEISAFGSKGDITICDDPGRLSEALVNMNDLGYTKLVVQQFLRKEYEVCAYGCLVENRHLCAGGTIRKVREFPPQGGGSLTYAQFIDEEAVNVLRDKVLNVLYNAGYRGQYDVELLVCKEGVYLNEINFRHSGNGYALVQNGVHAPYIWCADAVGAKITGKMKTSVKTGKCHMDELSDLLHLRDNHVSVFSWFLDCFRTSAFAKWDIQDLRGTFAYYAPLLKAVTRKLFHRRGR